MATQKPQRYVLVARHATAESQRFLVEAFNAMGGRGAKAASAVGPSKVPMRVVDSVHENGTKLVELRPEDVLKLHQTQPGIKLVPEVFYHVMVDRPQIQRRASTAGAATVSTKLTITVVSNVDGSPVRDVPVVAFTDFANAVGDQGVTNSKGQVSLRISPRAKIERLYAYPNVGYWSLLKKNWSAGPSGGVVELRAIGFPYDDCVSVMSPGTTTGSGVKVGIVDTGVGPHPDVVVSGGENTVTGENPSDFADNGERHGTHVAGIVAARGAAPTGRRGIAPDAKIYAYRVFGKGSDGASNFSIAKAIDRAVAAGCDLINMSLGGGDPDDATRAAIDDARDRGVLCIVAAGNDSRNPVSFPASYGMSVAVSAMGRKGTFPGDSTAAGAVAAPYGTDKQNFIAAFSNIGDEIDLTGPGVGVLSTVPGGYADMSGTSMACPAVTGLAARVLAANPNILGMSRNASRRDAIAAALLQSCVLLGFGKVYEGSGLPRQA